MLLERRRVLQLGALAAGASALGGWLPADASTAATGLPAWAPADATGPFDPRVGLYNWHATNTARTRQSLIDAAVSDQHHLFVGDSITAGWNSLNLALQGFADRDRSWPYYYRRELAKLLGTSEGGTGLVRSFELVNPAGQAYFDARWSPGPNGIGVQSRGHYVQVVNTTVTFDSAHPKFTPVAGTRVAVTYFDTATFTIAVDGGTAVTVPTGSTGAIRRFEIGTLPHRPHKITLKVPQGPGLKLIGAEVVADNGIHAHNLAQGGSGVTGGTQKDWSATGSPQAAMSPCFRTSDLYSRAPSTVFVELGGNDLNANAGDLGKIRDGIEETASFFPGSDIVLLGLAQASSQFTDVDVRPLLTMLYRLADARDWPLWDLQAWLGGFEELKARGYVGDAYGHLNPAGYELLGTTMARIAAAADDPLPPEPVGTGLSITETTVPAGLIARMYPSTTLHATGGKATYTWTLAKGALPAGLKLSTSGVISGTPTAAGTSTFTVLVKDASVPAKTGVQRFTLTVAPMTVTTLGVPNVLVGKTYPSTTLKVAGGKATYVWSVVDGALPTGIKLSSGGVLSGTPSTPGTRTFTVQVADGSIPKLYATQAFQIAVGPMTIATAVLPNGLVAKTYPSIRLTLSGGKSSGAWSIVAGSLPPGVKMSSTGTFSGTPTTAGTSTFTVRAVDTSFPDNVATKQFTVTVAPMTVATTALPPGAVGKLYPSTKLAANGGKATLVWTVASGTLPPGIKMSTTGTFSGTPTRAGRYVARYRVTDASVPKNVAEAELSITVT